MFLVVVRCNMDDIPLQLFPDLVSATRRALEFSWDDLPQAAANIGWNCSDPCTIVIVEFAEDGTPKDTSLVRRASDEFESDEESDDEEEEDEFFEPYKDWDPADDLDDSEIE